MSGPGSLGWHAVRCHLCSVWFEACNRCSWPVPLHFEFWMYYPSRSKAHAKVLQNLVVPSLPVSLPAGPLPLALACFLGKR